MSQKLYIVRRNNGQGGAERVAERLAQNFSDQFDVSRLWAGNLFNNEKIPGLFGPPWWRSWWYTRHINRLAIYNSDSVVYSLEYGPNCDIYRAGDGVHRLNVLRRFGSNKTWMLNPWHWLAPVLEKNSLESARFIIANSELVRTHILQVYPQVRRKIRVIYNGYDETEFRQSRQKKQKIRKQLGLPLIADKILLLSGSGFERKGLHHAVNVLKNLHERACKAYLVVIGKGDSYYVKSAIKQAGLENFIIFKGLVKKVALYYQAADVMVLLTRYDPFSNACLEALACGCPVITTRNNGATEVMKAFSGLIVDDISQQNAISDCGDYIMQKNVSAVEISASVSHLLADKEKNAHLEIINQVFVEKKVR